MERLESGRKFVFDDGGSVRLAFLICVQVEELISRRSQGNRRFMIDEKRI
jgi:hypothetical protein